jgi:hypothetical protein
MASELDSESLSVLRKISFKRDSCKPLVDVISMTSACGIQKVSENSHSFRKYRKFQKGSESFRKFQKVVI